MRRQAHDPRLREAHDPRPEPLDEGHVGGVFADLLDTNPSLVYGGVATLGGAPSASGPRHVVGFWARITGQDSAFPYRYSFTAVLPQDGPPGDEAAGFEQVPDHYAGPRVDAPPDPNRPAALELTFREDVPHSEIVWMTPSSHSGGEGYAFRWYPGLFGYGSGPAGCVEIDVVTGVCPVFESDQGSGSGRDLHTADGEPLPPEFLPGSGRLLPDPFPGEGGSGTGSGPGNVLVGILVEKTKLCLPPSMIGAKFCEFNPVACCQLPAGSGPGSGSGPVLWTPPEPPPPPVVNCLPCGIPVRWMAFRLSLEQTCPEAAGDYVLVVNGGFPMTPGQLCNWAAGDGSNPGFPYLVGVVPDGVSYASIQYESAYNRWVLSVSGNYHHPPDDWQNWSLHWQCYAPTFDCVHDLALNFFTYAFTSGTGVCLPTSAAPPNDPLQNLYTTSHL